MAGSVLLALRNQSRQQLGNRVKRLRKHVAISEAQQCPSWLDHHFVVLIEFLGRHQRDPQRLGQRRGQNSRRVELILDATGVGLAIGDMLRERALEPKLVLFTGSDKLNPQRGVTMVGKGWMVSRMQVLLQSQRLHLPRSVEAGVLTRELMDYRIDVSDDGHASFNAKSGTHDDLVIALGLSCGVERSVGQATSRSYIDQVPSREERLQGAGRWPRQRE